MTWVTWLGAGGSISLADGEEPGPLEAEAAHMREEPPPATRSTDPIDSFLDLHLHPEFLDFRVQVEACHPMENSVLAPHQQKDCGPAAEDSTRSHRHHRPFCGQEETVHVFDSCDRLTGFF